MYSPFLVEHLLCIHDYRLLIGGYFRDYLVYAVFKIVVVRAHRNIGVGSSPCFGRTRRAIAAPFASTYASHIIYQMLLMLLDLLQVF